MNNDEELQKWIEAGKIPPGNGVDAKAYREVFARLRKEPDAYLPAGFAEKVIVRIQRQQLKSSSRDIYWLFGGVFLLIVAMIVAVAFSGFKPGLGFLKDISAYAGVFAFGVVFILFLNRLDKKFLPKDQV